MRHAKPLPLLWLVLALVTSGCDALPDIRANSVCGNGVIEPENDEDCEPGRRLPDGLVCGESDDELACKIVCADDDGEGRRIADCPDGWGCALAGYCQPPSGKFAEPEVVPGITTPMSIGDFDGDFYPDLAAVQEPLLSVAFGNIDTDYRVTLTAPIDSSPRAPLIGDLDGDGDDDLVVNAGEQFTIYWGEPDQTLAPVIVPEVLFPELPDEIELVSMPVNDRFGRHFPLLLTLEEGEVVVRYADLFFDDDFQLDVGVPSPGTELPGAVATGDLLPADAPDEVPVYEIAIAPHRGDAVVVFALECELGDQRPMRDEIFDPDCTFDEVARVRAPPGWQVSSAGTFMADADGDGRTDLLFGLQGPDGQGVALARGIADGLAQAVHIEAIEYTGVGPMGQTPPVMPGAQMMAPPPWLLAIADLDGNGLADVVTADRVIFAEADPDSEAISYLEGFEIGRRWNQIHVRDVNRDDRPDLVGVIGSLVAVHLNVDGRTFNTAEAVLDANDIDVHVGDFDGDLYPDLLVTADTRLLLAFNDGRGLVSGFREALTVDGDLFALAMGLSDDTDAIDDVVMAVRLPDGTGYGVSLRGSATRRLAAPLDLDAPIDATILLEGPIDEDGTPFVRPLVGERAGDPLAGGEWTFRAVDESALFGALFTEPPALMTEGDCAFPLASGLLSAAFRASPSDDFEMAAVVPTDAPEVPLELRGPWVPRLVRHDGGLTLHCTALEATPLPGKPHDVEVVDIDGDAVLDLVVSHRSERMPGDEMAVEGGLTIYWGTGAGEFSASGEPFVLVSPASGGQGGEGDQAGDFTGILDPIETNGRPGSELLVHFGNGLHLLTFDPAQRTFGAPSLLPRQRIVPGDVTRVDAIDLDLDGVTDMVLSGPRQTVLVLQRPCTAQEADEGECNRDIGLGEL